MFPEFTHIDLWDHHKITQKVAHSSAKRTALSMANLADPIKDLVYMAKKAILERRGRLIFFCDLRKEPYRSRRINLTSRLATLLKRRKGPAFLRGL